MREYPMTLSRRWLAPVAAVAAGLGLAAAAPTAFAATASPQPRSAVNFRVVTLRLASDPSQLANVTGSSLADGAAVIQYPWSGTSNERWLVTSDNNGYYRFASLNANKCLNVQGGGTADGTPVIQYTCTADGAPNEEWRLVPAGNGYQIVAKSSGKCLNVRGGTGVGNPLIQFTCVAGGATNDTWLPVWEPTNQ
jgi:hypothetical protein